MNLFWTILIAVGIFGFLILIHELGHFIAAKWCGVPVRAFSIGMGPAIFKKEHKGTLYSLRIFPIGGYVMLVGEDEETDDPDSFTKKPIWKRAIVFFAGAFMNLLFGLIVSAILIVSAPAIASNTVAQFSETATSVETGLQEGDTITSINGSPVYISTDISFLLMRAKDDPVRVGVVRDGEKMILESVQFPVYEEQGLTYAAADFYLYRAEKTPLAVLEQSFFRAVSVTRAVWSSVLDLIKGQVPLSSLSGPVGTTTVIGEAASYGWDSLLFLVLVITINLGIMNLLPFPALDGGKLLFLFIEWIIRRPLPQKFEMVANMVGFALLMLLMVVVAVGDVQKLIFKG